MPEYLNMLFTTTALYNNVLVINNITEEDFGKKFNDTKHIVAKGITSEIRILRIESVNLYFLRNFSYG